MDRVYVAQGEDSETKWINNNADLCIVLLIVRQYF